jgi:hypothetical protein
MLQGFSAIVRGRFDDAFICQPNSIILFSFLLVQFFIRIAAIWLLFKTAIPIKLVTGIDLTLLLVLFIFSFRGILPQSIYIFYKMLLTGNLV